MLVISNVDASRLQGQMTFTENGTTEPFNGTMSYNAETSQMHFQGTYVMLGVTVPFELDLPFSWGGHLLYQCDQKTLLLDPYSPSGLDGQYITWNRIP
jgi:hypothetical protein